jgi:phosphoglycerate dehydrogenase-like enzyme
MSHGEFRTDFPFMELPNVIGSPHDSPIVEGSSLNATVLAAENVKRFLNNEQIHGIIDRNDYE